MEVEGENVKTPLIALKISNEGITNEQSTHHEKGFDGYGASCESLNIPLV